MAEYHAGLHLDYFERQKRRHTTIEDQGEQAPENDMSLEKEPKRESEKPTVSKEYSGRSAQSKETGSTDKALKA